MQSDLQKDIATLISFHSATGDSEGLFLCAKWIESWLKKHLSETTVQIELVEKNGIPSVLAVLGEWKHPKILLNGHFDVVPGTPDQFSPVLKGDKMYGRGAADMKASVVSLMHAFVRIVTENPQVSIGLMLTGDEEIGGENGARWLVEDEGWKTDMLINLDGGYSEQISHAEKGIIRLQIICKGDKNPVNKPWLGVSAFEKCVLTYQILHNMFPDRHEATDDNNWISTFVVKSIQTGPDNNATLDLVDVRISIHFVENTEPTDIINTIRDQAPQGVEIISEMEVPRVYVDPDDPTLLAFQKTYGSHLGHFPVIRGENGSSDARYFSHMNIPIIITKPLSGNPEADNEWVSLSSAQKLTDAVVDFVLKKSESF